MAETLHALQSHFNALDVPIFSDGTHTLLYRYIHRAQVLDVLINIAEEGEYVRFIMPWYLNLYEGDGRDAVMLKLLELNNSYKLLKFNCDPADGEISVAIELYVGEGALTREQVWRCISLFSNVAITERDRLLTLQRSGIYPSSDNRGFEDTVRRMLESPTDELPEDIAGNEVEAADEIKDEVKQDLKYPTN